VVLSGLALLAIWLDPTQPTRLASLTYWTLLAYCALATVLWIDALRSRRPRSAISVGAHLTDLAVFTLLMALTDGITSPFFIFFTFSILCASLRWRTRGTLATGGIMLLALIGTAVWPWVGELQPDFEWNRLMIRTTYAVVIVFLFAYIGIEQERQLGEIAKLSIHGDYPAPDSTLQACLEHVRLVFPKAGVALIYSQPDEPWTFVGALTDAGFAQSREPPTLLHGEGAAFVGQSFYTADLADPASPVLLGDGLAAVCADLALDPALVERFPGRPAMVVPVNGRLARGLILVRGVPNMTHDDLILGEILAGQIASRLDHMLLSQQLSHAAAAGERVRLAGEIHDTVMQSLTGIRLRIQALLQSEKLAEGASRLAEIRDDLSEELNTLRAYVGELSPDEPRSPQGQVALAASIEATTRRLARRWDVEFHSERMPRDLAMPATQVHEILCIIAEATANAVRHGGASVLTIEVESEGHGLELRISDNGSGFLPHGIHTHSELLAGGVGPRSILRRVAVLHAAMNLTSSPKGVSLEIVVPAGEVDYQFVA
jgi:signal transduction histidine kinase